ncbi:flavin reductase family protein [Nocardiopsis coralliicola]
MSRTARLHAAPHSPAAPPAVDADTFRSALAAHAAGVVAVTAADDGGPVGLTATSFTSLSLDPPLVAFAIAATSTTWPRLRRADRFAVNLLTEDQHELAARFARRGGDRFAPPTEWEPGAGGAPLLAGAAVHLECVPERIVEAGDHWLVLGRVCAARTAGPHRPLLYHQRAFGALRRIA